jgi:pantoate kinase
MRAFVPSHITGFFAAKRSDDLVKSGSIGCGLCLSLGAITAVQASEETEILLNGQASVAPVSRFVVEKIAESKSPVCVKTQLDMPLGAGFGASGAGALGAAYALNAYFDLGLTANGAATIAHMAEVSHRTGLGDVIAQNTGGLVIRLEAGAPGRGVVDRIPVPSLKVNYVVRGPISTKDVLSDPKVMKEINREGEACLKELLRRPTLKEFMALSRRFTSRIGLASDWALEAIEAVEAAGGMASMIMLGDSVFAIGGDEALKEFGEVGITSISQRGANLD